MSNWFKQSRSWRWPAGLLVILGVLLLVMLVSGAKKEVVELEEVLPQVRVKTVAELGAGGVIEKIGVIEPAVAAALVARTGGRVTEIKAEVGEVVAAGKTLIVIDGGEEANPARIGAQVAAAQAAAFERVAKQATAAAANAVQLAELTVQQSATGKGLSAEAARKQRELAEVAVRQASFAQEEAQEAGIDLQLRAANLALMAAELQQDQATLAVRSALQQGNEMLAQTQASLAGVKIAQARVVAELQSQRVALKGQAQVAQEQWRASQVLTPIQGTVTALRVSVGEIVQPGERIGEVNALVGAQVNLEVVEAVREQLMEGAIVPLRTAGAEFSGRVMSLASAPASATGLWQVKILIETTPVVVHAGEVVTALLPVRVEGEQRVLLPLDATVVRQNGVVVWMVDEEQRVREKAVRVVGYAGEWVEVEIDLVSAGDRVVVEGNRLLREGQAVRVRE
jgi:RND family efflux transporter MFP subunit